MRSVPGGAYHRFAPSDAVFPYKTFTLKSVSFNEAREDFDLCVDVWNRGDYKTAEEIADQIEATFRDANLPSPPLYPTFFRENRYTIEDPDKELQHIQLRFSVQLYSQEE